MSWKNVPETTQEIGFDDESSHGRVACTVQQLKVVEQDAFWPFPVLTEPDRLVDTTADS